MQDALILGQVAHCHITTVSILSYVCAKSILFPWSHGIWPLAEGEIWPLGYGLWCHIAYIAIRHYQGSPAVMKPCPTTYGGIWLTGKSVCNHAYVQGDLSSCPALITPY